MVHIKFQILFIISILICGCTRKSAEKSEATTDVVGGMKCYTYAENRDTIQLKIATLNNSVTGNLTYNLFEKDINRGTLVGSIQGDTLFADYTFVSEGVESIREVAFFKVGEDFVEGFGEIEEQNGKQVFINPSELRLNNQFILKSVNCN
jgi:hypothetical protein